MELVRKPIICRTAIYQRTACYSDTAIYDGCNLCDKYTSCDKSYGDNLKVIYISEEQNWQEVINRIWELHDTGMFLHLIIDVEIPKEVLWAASYSEKNIFQVNVNMVGFSDDNLKWVRRLVFMSVNCGLYVVLFLYPIIPDLVKTYHIIDVIDMFRNVVHFHVNLKFVEFKNAQECGGYINFNGIPVSTKNLYSYQGIWKCSESYMNEFMEIVKLYTNPRKISVGVCGEDSNCTGLGG